MSVRERARCHAGEPNCVLRLGPRASHGHRGPHRPCRAWDEQTGQLRDARWACRGGAGADLIGLDTVLLPQRRRRPALGLCRRPVVAGMDLFAVEDAGVAWGWSFRIPTVAMGGHGRIIFARALAVRAA